MGRQSWFRFARSRGAFVALCIPPLAGAGCSADKNHEQRADAQAAQPEGATEADVSCIDQCYPDPGSRPVSADDCAEAEQGLEFYPLPLWNFEGGVAANLYTYDDNSTLNRNVLQGWEPPTEPDPWQRCGSQSNEVFHIDGGPFLEWGGGIGRSLKCMNNRTEEKHGHFKVGGPFEGQLEAFDLKTGCGTALTGLKLEGGLSDDTGACYSEQPDSLVASACPEIDEQFRGVANWRELSEGMEEEYLLGMTLDLSEWDGISFWARRSPNSQPGFRLAVGDKYTDDDLSYLQYHISPDSPRHCERNVECGCRGDRECTPEVDILDSIKAAGITPVPTDAQPGAHRCYFADFDNPKIADLEGDFDHLPRCGQTACDQEYKPFQDESDDLQGFDAQAYGKPCTAYAFRGSIVDAYCYEPGVDPDPSEGESLCGDHWMKPVRLSTDWEFYKVPFTSLIQQGWAKEFASLDLTALSVVRFTWERGWIDYWVDDVRFYRVRRD